ncbi:MAG: glycosyltransferase family 2 protein [Phycisphaerales bacterium]|jgi:GT2 family glycosyltransferase|nr:glycosyltransferase family 2 protein [Phycisphaerales bacterium]
MTPDVSILVVSYNTRELTLACLRSIAHETTRPHEVIVVDNASTDGSPAAIRAEFPGVTLIEPGANLGFAAANNLAARHANAPLLLLLNPDTVVLDRAIDTLTEFTHAHPDASIFGGRTLREDRTLDPVCVMGMPSTWSFLCEGVGLNHLFARTRLFDPISFGPWKRDSVRRVPVITGAFLMIRRDLWSTLAGMDERFFLYCEEVDLCMRARELGHSCEFCPGAEIVHLGSASQRVRADRFVRTQRAKAQLIRKHFRPPARELSLFFLALRVWTRRVASRMLGVALPRYRDPSREWREIWNRRREWLDEHPLATAPRPAHATEPRT